ncbi:MAG: Hsp20 family protein [Asticcacaulis sp.]|nr:Hsp20 family protein [Asticcacaulis sp.]
MTSAFSLSPLYGSSVGFDRFTDLFETLGRTPELGTTFPTYDVEKLDTDRYRISLAVPGFSDADLTLTVQDTQLIVTGKKQSVKKPDSAFLYKGIAVRDFSQTFQLADYVTVTDAELTDGLLKIDLVRKLPEAQKPRTIPIKANPEPKTLSHQTSTQPGAA